MVFVLTFVLWDILYIKNFQDSVTKQKVVLVALPFQEAWAYFQHFMIDKILQEVLTFINIFPMLFSGS